VNQKDSGLVKAEDILFFPPVFYQALARAL